MTSLPITWLRATIVAALACAAAASEAQRASELHIPIGQSPGVSGRLSYQGVVTRLNGAHTFVAVSVNGREMVCAFTSRTRIWLDRSDMQAPNMRVPRDELRVGDVIELKPGKPTAADIPPLNSATLVAEWIKIRASKRQAVRQLDASRR